MAPPVVEEMALSDAKEIDLPGVKELAHPAGKQRLFHL